MTASRRTQQQVAARRERIIGMRARGMSFEQIGRVENIRPSAAAQDWTRAMRARVAAHGDKGDDIQLELIRLDGLERAAQTVMAANMPRPDADPTVLGDEKIVLDAIDRLLRISRRRGEVLGWGIDGAHLAPPAPVIKSRYDELAKRRADRRAAGAG